MSFRNTNLKIIKDTDSDYVRGKRTMIIPIMDSTNFPPSVFPGVGGGIGYDKITKRVYYNDGSIWIPLASSATNSVTKSFSLIKNLDLNVPNITDTVITSYSSTPDPPYHDNTTGGWNLVTGEYTADFNQQILLNVSFSWLGGISNLGNRYLYVIYKPVAGAAMIAKETVTQADPDLLVDTTQETSIAINLETGDKIWLEVFQDSGNDLVVVGDNTTSISGVEVYSL